MITKAKQIYQLHKHELDKDSDTDAQVEQLIELADNDQNMGFNSGDLSSDQAADLFEALEELVAGGR